MSKNSESMWRRVRQLRPLILAQRAESDRLRRLPDPVAQAFLDNNLYRALIPEDLGGEDIDPITYFDLSEELSSYDGAVGWNFALGSTNSTLVGELPLDRLREFYAQSDCCIAGTIMPGGRAKPVDGGYRLSGRWSWASGVHQARWVIVGAIVEDGDKPKLNAEGTPFVRQFLLQKETNGIQDMWHVGGMRGTGSTDYAATEVFVPEDMIVRAFSGVSSHPAPVFRLPSTFFGLGPCAVALGVARSAVEGLRMLAISKSSAGTRIRLSDNAQVQYAAAKADALLDSSRLLVRDAFKPLWECVVNRDPVGYAMKARVRASYVHAAESAIEAVQLCYRASGGTGLFENAPFERAQRDVNAVACHITMQRLMMEEAGRLSFGLAPSFAMF